MNLLQTGRVSRILLVATVVALLAGCSSSGSEGSEGSGGSSDSTALGVDQPNVLFVLTDDMRYDELQYMPHVRELLGDQGLSFDQYLDNVTLCCPARTSILRGQYAHNTGVLSNAGDDGGFEAAYAKQIEESTVATALQGAGYRTGLFGKYLNGYPNNAPADYIPPGWDTWSSSPKGNAYGEYDYTLNENGRMVDYGHAPGDYGTDVYVRQTADFIHEATDEGKPFLAYLSVYAPHKPSTPAPQDVDLFPDLKAPRDPAFDEADVSDKPQYIRDLPRLDEKKQANIDRQARLRAQSLQAVDRGVAALVADLERSGHLDDTYVVFASDNGFHLGQHRMAAGKQSAYETDVHLPLLVRGPGVAPGSHTAALAGNTDLAPTFVDLAGTSLAHTADGRSLVPLLRARPGPSGEVPVPADWRAAYLLEHWADAPATEDRPGAGELEPPDGDQGPRRTAASLSIVPGFQGLRTATLTYVEYVTGERELYDRSTDPDELQNLAATADPGLVDSLHQQLDQLRPCVGEACWTAEGTAGS